MSAITLSSNVNLLYGIGKEYAEKLAKLGIETIYDLITYLPFRYSDWTSVRTISEAMDCNEVSFYGQVVKAPFRGGYKHNSPVNMTVGDTTGMLALTFFNSPYLKDKFERGTKCFVHGVVTCYNGKYQMVNPHIEKDVDNKETRLVRPIYRLTSGLNSNMINKWIKTALSLVANSLPDFIPPQLVKDEKLCSPLDSYMFVHFPKSMDQAQEGRKRLAFEELILLGVGMKLSSGNENANQKAIKVVSKDEGLSKITHNRWEKIISNLGFELTDDQKKAFKEVQLNLMSDRPMNRLVQGDVGSGKTVVALLSMAIVGLMGMQAVLLAPTSVLAKQHFDNACKLLDGSGLNIVLLMGKTKASEKKKIRQDIASNKASIIIGTHALLSDEIEYSNLALVIADEQHRFGVKQREKLLINKSSQEGINSVHNLIMTATPIPRTLAMVVYADMQTSVIRHKPKGRQEVETCFIRSIDDKKIFEILINALNRGEQAYIVCPRISSNEEELSDDRIVENTQNEEIEMQSVQSMMKLLKDSGLSDRFETRALYGSMKETEKLRVMESFLSMDTKLIVSTTVIEVGVDNPNATVMIIYDSENFGLSTLHQLRGRVGRGDKKSICLLVSQTKSQLACQRLELMCHSSDGFDLANKDLELRGPGDFFGTRQHGIPTLRAANLFTDASLAKIACDSVNEVLKKDDEEASKLKETINMAFKMRFANKINAL